MQLHVATIVSLPLLLVLSLTLASHLISRWDAGAQTLDPPCGSFEAQEEVRALLEQAIDQALKQHIQHLYEVWMKDVRAGPERASVGVRHGINTYLYAQRAVAEWKLPLCKEAK